jgi:hypothetical protein
MNAVFLRDDGDDDDIMVSVEHLRHDVTPE